VHPVNATEKALLPFKQSKMPVKRNIAPILMLQFLEEQLTPEEEKELNEFEAIGNNHQAVKELTNGDSLIRQLAMIELIKNDKKEFKEKVKQELFPATPALPAPVFRINHWLKYSAAAAIILVAGILIWYFTKPPKKTGIVIQNNIEGNDVLPGAKKATLTLVDNREIELNSINKNGIPWQGPTRLLQQDSQLVYDYTGAQTSSKALYNILSTPPGGKYQVQLPDKSRVWLNAASSIKFPVAFTGQERRVEITGEAYFEVAGNKSRNNPLPFIVDVKNNSGITELRVLGTHFNVMAYRDEPSITATVLEGKVKVQSQGASDQAVTLFRGDLANIAQNKKIKVSQQADVEQEIAWKDNYFSFTKANTQTIMREIARWYNLQVEFEEGIPEDHYTGKISRSMTLKEVLMTLDFAGIKFKINGNKVLVTQ
jgi:hypothetical protein